MAPSETLSDDTRSQKSKMAAEKTKLNVAQFLHTIATKFQRLYPCFRGRASRLDYSEECSMCGKLRNQIWRQNEETSLITDRCLIQQEVLNGTHLIFIWVWLTITGSRYEITYISASTHDINEILTAIPMFSRSGDTKKLLRRLSDVRIRDKSKMAAINRK